MGGRQRGEREKAKLGANYRKREPSVTLSAARSRSTAEGTRATLPPERRACIASAPLVTPLGTVVLKTYSPIGPFTSMLSPTYTNGTRRKGVGGSRAQTSVSTHQLCHGALGERVTRVTRVTRRQKTVTHVSSSRYMTVITPLHGRYLELLHDLGERTTLRKARVDVGEVDLRR